jgi:hypothetical protein
MVLFRCQSYLTLNKEIFYADQGGGAINCMENYCVEPLLKIDIFKYAPMFKQ